MPVTNEQKSRIRKIYAIILTCTLITTALSLMGGCLYIYLSGGNSPFTEAAISAVFSKIGWLMWLSLGLIVGSVALQYFLPCDAKKKHRRQAMKKQKPIAPRTMAILRYSLLALGAVAVLLGICFDGVQAAVANAIALCMSCIGLG